MNKELIQEKHKSEFNIFPAIVCSSPGRINLIGEHTDYNGGLSLPAAINKHIFISISKTNESKCSIHALDRNETIHFDLLNIKKTNIQWLNYAYGVLIEMQKRHYGLRNFKCAIGGNIPIGVGLSSSAAFTCGFAFALNELLGFNIAKNELALIAQAAEHNLVGVKCGLLDQIAVLNAKENHFLKIEFEKNTFELFDFDLGAYDIVLFDTGVHHNLASSAYNERRNACEKVLNAYNTTYKTTHDYLSQVDSAKLEELKNTIGEADYLKSSYVLEENHRVEAFIAAVKNNDLTTAGEYLYQSHAGLKDKYMVSCAELDFLVDQLKTNNGVAGSRMMGGGFGGCTLNFILKDRVKETYSHLAKNYYMQFGLILNHYVFSTSDGVKIIN